MTEPTHEAAPAGIALASSEDAATVADWEKATADVLRKSRKMSESDPDSDVWAVLTRTTLDDISVAPISTAADLDGLRTAGRPARQGDWDNRPQLAADTSAALNEQVLVDLENGATSLFLVPSAAVDLQDALAGVLLDLAPVVLHRPTAAESAAFAALLRDSETRVHRGHNLSADPITAEMFGHRAAQDGRSPAETFLETARLAAEIGVLGVVVDAAALHDQGASDAQELGWSIAVGVHYLRQLTEAGFSLAEAAALIEFRYAASDEQFQTIAKFRAARRLWARVLELSGGAAVEQRQHAVTSRAMMSKYDPYVNMLRTTVAAFAAGVGGADAVTVLPFDTRFGASDAFGRRIARNTSSLLLAESHLGRVTDPAGGSYAVEKLTDDLALAGWSELGTIEAEGGVTSDAARNGLKVRVAQVVAARNDLIAHRTMPITGVSEFPNLAETLPVARPGAAVANGFAYAAPFEDLRDAPAVAPVFLATMGSVAAHTARATFASNLLAAGGVSVTVAGATSDAADLVSRLAGEKVACLAGADATYAEWGAEAVAALRAAGVERVIIAGKPRDLAVDDSCAVGIDALAFLNRTREALA